KTFSPESVVGTHGGDAIWRGGFAYRGRRVDGRASYSSLGERFNDELGFVPRTGIDRLDAAYGMHFRPKAVSGWLREIYPHWQIVNITKPGAGAFDSRFIDYHLPFTLQNSTFIETGVNANIEVLTDEFEINSNRHIVV